MLSCSVVRDLLPAYLEQLTGKETNREIEEHLAGCEECRKISEMMAAGVSLEKAGEPKARILISLKLSQIFSVLMVIVFVWVIVFGLTADRKRYDISNTSITEQQLEEFKDNVTVLQTAKLLNRAYVLYSYDPNDKVHTDKDFGVLELIRMVDGSYGIISDTDSSSLTYCAWPVQIGRFHYVLLSGARELPGVETVKVTGVYKGKTEVCYEGPVAEGAVLHTIRVSKAYTDLSVQYYAADGSEVEEVDLQRQLSQRDLSKWSDRDVSAIYMLGGTYGYNPYSRSSSHNTGFFMENFICDQGLILLLTVALVMIRYLLYQGMHGRYWEWIPVGAMVILSAVAGNKNLVFALIVLGVKMVMIRIRRKRKEKYN